MAGAEEESARLVREGVERMEEMEGRIIESEMRRDKAEEKRRELETKLVSTDRVYSTTYCISIDCRLNWRLLELPLLSKDCQREIID